MHPNWNSILTSQYKIYLQHFETAHKEVFLVLVKNYCLMIVEVNNGKGQRFHFSSKGR